MIVFKMLKQGNSVVEKTILDNSPLQHEASDLAIKALRAVLADVPGVNCLEVQEEPPNDLRSRRGYRITLLVRGVPRMLLIEFRSSGQPRLARDAANQLLRITSRAPDLYPVFAAPYISARAAEICREENIGYVDSAGNCRLVFDSIYIRVAGNENIFSTRRFLRSLYSPRAERVLRVLLNNPGKTWRIQELANQADVSVGQVANVKQLLADREWIRSETGGFTLIQPEALLSEWAESYRFKRSMARSFYSMRSPAEVEADLSRVCEEEGIPYALTGFSGAARYAPFVRYQRSAAYIACRTDDVAERMGLKEVSSGANVVLLTPYDEGVFYGMHQIGGERVVSAVQCYLDVRNMAARGLEAAEALLERVIKPAW